MSRGTIAGAETSAVAVRKQGIKERNEVNTGDESQLHCAKDHQNCEQECRRDRSAQFRYSKSSSVNQIQLPLGLTRFTDSLADSNARKKIREVPENGKPYH